MEAYICAVRHGALRVPVRGESPGQAESMYRICILSENTCTIDVHVFSLTSGSHYD